MKHDKKRIEELEERVRQLEARPYWPMTIIVQPAPQPTLPAPAFVPTWPNQPRPFGEPWIVYNDGHVVTYS